MPLGPDSLRIALAGATTLLGKDLAKWIEESGFPAGNIRLLDDESAAGLLTEAVGEPAIVQTVDESSFDRIRFAFFASSAAYVAQHAPGAERAGATVIDMSGVPGGSKGRPWIPHLDSILAPPSPVALPGSRSSFWLSPSTPAIVACSLSAALAPLAPARVALTFFRPASERGEAGVTELEEQTVKLFSLHTMPQEVFGTQLAFNMMDRWGESSAERLSTARDAIAAEVKAYLSGRVTMPALTLVQAPVFFGYTFSAYVEFSKAPGPDAVGTLSTALGRAGFKIVPPEEPGPSNLSAAAENQPIISPARADANVENGFWLWGAADNLRLASVNALRIAERLLAS